MILHFSYEELNALNEGARAVMGAVDASGVCAVATLPEDRARVEALVPRLDGDITVTTLGDQASVEGAIGAIVECLSAEMEAAVVATHPAAEGAVSAYFSYAHARSVLARVREMGDEMRALIEVVTGEPADDEAAAAFHFPD